MTYLIISAIYFLAEQMARINSKASMLFYLEEPTPPNE